MRRKLRVVVQLAVAAALAATVLVAHPVPSEAAAQVTVNSTADHDDGTCLPAPIGDCTLREAISLANTVPGPDTIVFDLADGGPYVVAPTTELPTIVDPVTIDGTSQAGYAGSPLITVSGTAAPATAVGLTIVSGGSLIQGIAITGFGGSAIALSTGSANVVHNDVLGVAGAGNGYGIRILDGSSYNQVGGASPGDGNVIANNANAGIEVASGDGNALLANAIHDNGQMGIDLLPAGATRNDPLDSDSGPNGLQNAPRLSAGTTEGSRVFASGDLDSQPSTLYRIELFATPACDTPSYTGEGPTFLGATSVTTDASGTGRFTAGFDADVPVGEFLTSTATDPGGSTSEFSGCRVVAGPPSVSISDSRSLEAGSGIPVVLVGNSLMNTSKEELGALLPTGGRFQPTIDAVSGSGLIRSDVDWPPRIGQLVKTVRPQELVVELGTNDTELLGPEGYGAAIDRVMAQTAGVRQVWWMNVSDRTASSARNLGAQRINADLLAASTRWPTLQIIDFSHEVTADHFNMDCLDGWGLCDSVHINYRGQRAFAELVEHALGVGSASFSVTLSSPSARPVTFTAATTDGTALASTDYETTNVDITFAPGEEVKRFAVPLVDDAAAEPDERFSADITGVINGTFGDAHGDALVLDDDHQRPLAVAGPDQTVSSGAAIRLDGSGSSDPGGLPLIFQWEQVDGPAAVVRADRSAQTQVDGVVGPAKMTFRLTAIDSAGLHSEDDVMITVRAPK